MNLFTKIDRLIDYNNHYSLRKGLETLRQEFEASVQHKDVAYAKEILDTVKRIYDKLHATYRQTEGYEETMSFAQRIMSAKMQKFIEYLTQKIRKEFGSAYFEGTIDVDQ